LHWVLFFESIKMSTVSVTLVCLSSVTLFTALIEPFIHKRRISKMEVLAGLLIIIGIYLIFRFESEYIKGITLGLLAALSAALFNIINSRLIKKGEAMTISMYEMLGASVWISVFLVITGGIDRSMAVNGADLLYLLLLGVVCTSGAYVAAVSVMKEISAFRVALASNMEPIYGILLAWLFFGRSEVMSTGFYIGTVIILASVFLYPVVRIRIENRRSKIRGCLKRSTSFCLLGVDWLNLVMGTKRSTAVVFKPYDQSQVSLLPPSLEELIAANHPVRIVNKVIDAIDIRPINRKYKGGGASSYHPRLLLKVLVYGYLTNVYSSRKLEDQVRQNIHFMWLTGMRTPDHHTINRFRSERLSGVLKEI